MPKIETQSQNIVLTTSFDLPIALNQERVQENTDTTVALSAPYSI